MTLTKRFAYRGADELWSNTYHFVGSAPTSTADWRSLVDDLVAIEKAVYPDTVVVVEALCYENTDEDSVYTYHLADFGGEVSGTFTPDAGDQRITGDDACIVGWDTGARNSQGKPIWLRKYFHGGYNDGTDQDRVSDALQASLGSFATDVAASSGAWPGIANPSGDAPTGGTRVSEWITTRTLKRRGRRPT